MLSMETIGKLIKIARFNTGLDQKQLAETINVPKEYISYWESNKRTPSLEHVEALAKTLNVTPNYFFGLEDSNATENGARGTANLRMAGEVSCGNLTYATTENGEYVTEEIPVAILSKYGQLGKKELEDNYFILRANGDSMSPYIENGDTLICKRSQDIDSGKIGIIVSADSEATAKVISKAKGEVRLIPLNKKYNEIIITPQDEEYRVIAEVVYVMRKVRTFII